MESPMCLIENAGTLRVVPEALSYLMGVSQPVVVVAIVGLYRTGKSYLLNKLAGKQKGFALGATIQSKTKGIWMWCVPHPVKKDHTLVLLDTEGLGDVEKGDQKNDAWIFALSILLSSTLVYNSRGTIDNHAVENLQYVTELTERIKVKSPASASSAEDDDDEADAQFVQFFPSFVWAVRDFTLLLEIDGKKVNDAEYLEHALALKKGRDRKTVDYNLPRECIRNYFPTRRCFVFETPAAPDKMAHLESIEESQLSSSFKAVSLMFCKYIYQESPVKRVKGGLPVTGRMLGHLAKTYVETIASGGVPCLENAVVALTQIENEAAVQEGLQVYRNGMKEVTFPVGMEEISKQHRHWDSQAIKAFSNRSFKDEKGEYMKKLLETINEVYAALLAENEEASEELCRQLLSQLSQPMATKLENGSYAKPGGYELYCVDRQALLDEYNRKPNKGVKAEKVLENFLKEKSTESTSVMQSDKQLTEKEKKINEEELRSLKLEQEKRRETQERQIAEQMLEEQGLRHQETVHHLKEKMKREAAEAQQEMELALQSKLQEQNVLMATGFKAKEAAMEEEIQRLQVGINEAKQKREMDMMGTVKDVMTVISTGLDTYYGYKKTREQRKLLAQKHQMSKGVKTPRQDANPTKNQSKSSVQNKSAQGVSTPSQKDGTSV
ncbi:guanylate-binding protein 1-like isoform X8 [Brienomyrus brachyistius]|nr:guanylate-binding protein 1-like isoform X8 [Brienomyrus brachyistius]XP_048882140.1 guanylate-binding protein 1-like isoform X8 [Brienomyrus brachyistius]XP_048882141.1 guanylate-binding protein 1-like isoform X8 [Brienomyrus brachyistius]XP_048882142.1 guanylate-binding protein 1-like isoform X8 [Brienomyrus brachyistius]XP_048882144.1 guanylate-binding protein 1-like isoform X8 [Brienomyrus brachyistius]XP_048882152.1 guanylate-binding protein 1-like isoform X8 [Brienomyrus brachyistius]